jgi:TetR/AcrR family transcriptional regulator, transcriptional repressor for nem operon
MSNLTSTSDEILACTRTLIIAGGYNGFSYADIANVVGIRKPSIHHHFPTKAELVRTLVSRYRHDAKAGIANLEQHITDPLKQLLAYTGYWEACIADASAPICICALLASELPVLPEAVALEVRAHFRALSEWLTSVLDRGAREARFSLIASPNVEAELFMATVHGAMLSARAYGDPAMFATIIAPLLGRLSRQ